MLPQRVCQQVIIVDGRQERKNKTSGAFKAIDSTPPPQHNTHNELIFPRLPVHTVRGDIDIHTSQRAPCQFPSLIQIRSERSANPLGSAGCEDDSPSCLKRKLQEQYTGGSSLIPRRVSARAPRLGAISPPKSNRRRRHLFVLLAVGRWSGFAKLPDSMSCAVNTRTCACNALLGRSHYNFSTPVTLTFTLVAAPKLNLYPPAAHLKFKAVGRIPAAQTHIHFGSNRNLFFFFSFSPGMAAFY